MRRSTLQWTAGIVTALSLAGCRTSSPTWSASWRPAPQYQYGANQYGQYGANQYVGVNPYQTGYAPAYQPVATAAPVSTITPAAVPVAAPMQTAPQFNGVQSTVVPASAPVTQGFVPPPLPPAED